MRKNYFFLTMAVLLIILFAFVSFVIYQIDTGNPVEQADSIQDKNIPEPEKKLYYSPDGKYLVLINNKFMEIFDIKAGKMIRQLEISGLPYLAFSPDSRSIAFIDETRKVKIFELEREKLNYLN
jgi:uncharacterized protein with WD repeat